MKKSHIAKLVLLVVYLVLSNFGLYDTIARQVGHNSIPKAMFLTCYASSFAALFVYYAFAASVRWRFIPYMLLLVSGFAGQYYWLITGHPITIDAIEIALINVAEVRGLFAEKLTEFVLAAATAAIGFVGVILPFRPERRGVLSLMRPVIWRSANIVVALMVLGTSGIVVWRNGYGMLGLPYQVSSIFPLPITLLSTNFSLVDYYDHQNDVSHSIVLIIDESVAFKQFKEVEALVRGGVFPAFHGKDLVLEFAANARSFHSLHNCSALSVWGIVNGLHLVSGDIKISASLWKRAKEAGFETVYISAQEVEGQHQYLQTLSDFALMDERHYFGLLPRNERDIVAARTVLDVLSSGQKKFVLVVKNGSHFPYFQQFSKNDSVPTLLSKEMPKNERDYLLSLYHNTYRFLGAFIEGVQQKDPPLVIYTSDHGQNLKAPGFAHCNSEKPHPDEWKVPLSFANVPNEVVDVVDHNSNLYDAIVQAMGYTKIAGHKDKIDSDIMLFGSLNSRLSSKVRNYNQKENE